MSLFSRGYIIKYGHCRILQNIQYSSQLLGDQKQKALFTIKPVYSSKIFQL